MIGPYRNRISIHWCVGATGGSPDKIALYGDEKTHPDLFCSPPYSVGRGWGWVYMLREAWVRLDFHPVSTLCSGLSAILTLPKMTDPQRIESLMPKLLYLVSALILTACNLTAPGVPVDVATATPLNAPMQQPTSDLPTPDYATPAAAQTDWVTYTNAANGYTVQRPRSVSLVEENNGGTVFIDDRIEITVVDFNPEEARGGGVPLRENIQDIMLGQLPARRMTGSVGSIGGVTPQSIEQVIVPHNNRYYVFTVYELKRSEWSGEAQRTLGPVPQTEVELFNSILTTLRFNS